MYRRRLIAAPVSCQIKMATHHQVRPVAPEPELLGGGKSSMIANVIAAQFGASRNWPFGAALSVLLLVITLLVLVVFALVAKRASRATGRGGWESLL